MCMSLSKCKQRLPGNLKHKPRKRKKKKKGVGTGEEKVTRRLIQSKPPGIIIVIIIIDATKTDIDYGGLQINSPSPTIP